MRIVDEDGNVIWTERRGVGPVIQPGPGAHASLRDQLMGATSSMDLIWELVPPRTPDVDGPPPAPSGRPPALDRFNREWRKYAGQEGGTRP